MSEERLEKHANKKAQLWERQPWDTDKSFFVFHIYYLPQEPPRSLNEAYKAYRFQSGVKQVPKRAPGVWQKWYRGENSRGKKIPGAANWEERANAWDDHQAHADMEEWEKRRKQVRELDWELGQELRDLATRMLKESPNFLQGKRRFIKGRDGQPDQEIITVAIKAEMLPKLAEIASKLQRLAAGEPTERKSHEHTGKDGGPIQHRRAEELTDDELAAIIFEEYGEWIDVWRRTPRNN